MSAEASELPYELVDQLAEPGRMVIPVRGRMLLVERTADGGLTQTRHGLYSFVPLLAP